MILSQIAAISADLSIGKNNDILWRYPEDLKYFKDMTLNKIIITGRKNFDSILKPKGKPLPRRYHIVISRHPASATYENVSFVTDIPQAYAIAEDLIAKKLYPDEVFIIGGAEIYQQTLKDCQTLYLTQIRKTADGDTFFPANYPEYFKRTAARTSLENPELTYETWTRT